VAEQAGHIGEGPAFAEQLKLVSRFFDRLVEMVPPKLYLGTEEGSRSTVHKSKDPPASKKKELSKQAKRAKVSIFYVFPLSTPREAYLFSCVRSLAERDSAFSKRSLTPMVQTELEPLSCSAELRLNKRLRKKVKITKMRSRVLQRLLLFNGGWT